MGARERRKEEGARRAQDEVGKRMTQEECVEEKGEESKNQTYKDSDVSNRHMTWWRNAWWVRMNDGSSMRSARGSAESGEQPEERPNRLATETPTRGRNKTVQQKHSAHCLAAIAATAATAAATGACLSSLFVSDLPTCGSVMDEFLDGGPFFGCSRTPQIVNAFGSWTSPTTSWRVACCGVRRWMRVACEWASSKFRPRAATGKWQTVAWRLRCLPVGKDCQTDTRGNNSRFVVDNFIMR